jgi:MinD-like ATPase involved in chromosome partitioning or flagellar assembly
VLITSSIPREGKTTLALSLAAYLSFLGKRVLLIDLGFRQRAHLGAAKDAAETGIVDLSLQGSPADLIRHNQETGVDYLPMASHRIDPLTFFASEQMLGFVRQMRERYDCVIIDGPPLLGAAEARLLPSLVDRLLLVVRWGRTRREIARNAMALLRDSGCLKEARNDFAASILTQVDLKRHARYRYGDVGEFLSSHKEYYSRPPRSGREMGDKEPTAGNDDMQAEPGRLFLQ